jgi:hypothetical protein
MKMKAISKCEERKLIENIEERKWRNEISADNAKGRKVMKIKICQWLMKAERK